MPQSDSKPKLTDAEREARQEKRRANQEALREQREAKRAAQNGKEERKPAKPAAMAKATQAASANTKPSAPKPAAPASNTANAQPAPAAARKPAPAATAPKPQAPPAPAPNVQPKPGPAAAKAQPSQPAKPQPPARPAPKPQPAQKHRPPAGRSFFRFRHVMVLFSFLAMVVGPSVVSGIYLWTIAVDQYSSSVGFSVRREDASSPTDVLIGLTNVSGSSSSDTDILFEYLQGQKLVSELNAELDLMDRWSLPTDEETLWKISSRDPVFALLPNAAIEDLMKYWQRMVHVSYATGTGLIEVQVRAFSAEDAHTISNALFIKSSEMINELSDVAREDSIRYTELELREAEERLRTAREVLTRFRNVNQIVDPELDLRSQASLLASLQTQKAESIIALDLLVRTVSENDPRLIQERRRLEVIEDRIEQERQSLGGSATPLAEDGLGFANLIGEYERLVVDREFAQEAYISARAAHDSALSEASRQSRYLAAYLEPTLAQSAAYPERFKLQAVLSMFLFLIWSIAVLIFYSIKDRR